MHADTSIILQLFDRPADDALARRIRKELGDEPILWSVVQFAELADACRRLGRSVEDHVDKLKRIVDVVPVDESIALTASKLKQEARRHKTSKDFALMDGLVLASARARSQKLLTLDPDFAAFPDAIVLSG